LHQVTQHQDDYRDAWIVQGYCEMTTERYDEALASFERAYALDPEKPETQYFLGRTLAAKGDAPSALTFFGYALKNGFEPQSDVRKAIAQEALKTGNPTLAMEQLDALARADGATVEDYEAFVRTAVQVSLPEEGYARAAEAAQRWPESGKAWKLVADTALATGRESEGRQALERARSLDPTIE
jgi:tetratricopeptide (TPR) repeat protein